MGKLFVTKHRTVDIYKKISSWWGAHNFPPIAVDFLPFEGFIVTKDGVELYAAFLYVTDSALCWIAYPVSNPEATKEQKQGGLEKLFSDMEAYAKQEGYKIIFTTSPLPRIQEALIESGFSLGDENVNHYLKLIK